MTEPHSFEIQRLTPDDRPLMGALMTVFADAFEDHETYLGAVPEDAYLKRFLAKEGVFVLVALHGDGVIGGLVAYELEKFEQARSEIYIYDLAVAAPHRRQGAATGLIKEFCVLARARGAYVVIVQADQGDEPAIALYTKLGTREDVLHFDIAVD